MSSPPEPEGPAGGGHRSVPRVRGAEPIAIVGMGCVFPGAPDLASYWSNLERGVDAISEVPPDRWDPVFFDPSSQAADRFYCRRGGFVEARVVPLSFGVMPRAVDGAEPDQLLALAVAQSAIRDAGLAEGGDWRERTCVVLGRGAYLGPGLARLEQRVRTGQQLVEILRGQIPGIAEETLQRIKEAFQAQLGPYGPDTVIGLVPNLAASRIANRLDLNGPAYTVDAACASALVAIDQACRELWSGRCDVALAGGVHLCHDVTLWSVFTQLGAMSRAQQIRPFDRRADGLLVGEGAGLLVLRRLADAEREGQRVYARILGVGLASDGRGATLLSPRVEGQLLALRRAWDQAAADPASVGLVEAHGTATVQGDQAELATLSRFFGPALPREGRAALGSVKSMIGHAMPAAGAAGVIKASLALHHRILPPTLHCEEPRAELEGSRFRLQAIAEPWEERRPTPRRAGVDAFGFGGIDAHVVLEEEPGRAARRSASPALPEQGGSADLRAKAERRSIQPERWLALSAGNPEALGSALERNEAVRQPGSHRLVLFDPTPERRAMAQKVVARERPWHGHDDLWFSPKRLLGEGGKTAFLFPGIEPTFEPRISDVAAHFGKSAPQLPDGNPSDPLEPGGSADRRAEAQGRSARLEETGLAVVAVSRLLYGALREIGIVPQALAGHSLGEWSAMIASEMIPPAKAQAFIDSIVPGRLEVPDVIFAAAGCSADRAREALLGLADVSISHDNCPHQVILCGHTASIETALARLRDRQVLSQKLPFRSGFHSPLFAPYLVPHRRHFAALPLQRPLVPLWSATSCEPYPSDPEAIRALALEHLVRPVRFRELIERLYAEGFRLFVQVGAGNGLPGFVEDTLRGRPQLAISANVKQRSGLEQLRRVAAAAFCAGLDLALEALEEARPPPPSTRPLALGLPLVRLPPMIDSTSAATPTADSAVMQRFAQSLQSVARAQREVSEAYAGREADRPRRWSAVRRLSVESHPYLLDHCFYRQPQGWPELADRYPLVPMTLSVEWLREAAESATGRETRALEQVRALRWLPVAPAATVTLRAEPDGEGTAVAIEGYAEARARQEGRGWTAPPPLAAPEPVPVAAEALYRDRWMFHGPAYQGVEALVAWGPDGIDGVLRVPSAPGALLDNAGQLFGLWVMLRAEKDHLALPIGLDRVDFFGRPPAVGSRVHCAVRIRSFDEREVGADLWLSLPDGQPFCRIEGWRDRRFDSDARLWTVLRWPERELLAQARPGGYHLVTDAWRSLPSRELLARRYLGQRERERLETVAPRQQGQWLNGRIAAKDAVRDLLWRGGSGPLFPIEIELGNDELGRPRVLGSFLDARRPIDVSLAHVAGAAVALARAGKRVGIDMERPDARPAGFAEAALTAHERRLLPPGDQWLARAWTAKEALGKARGTGLAGNPAKLPLQAIEGERLLIDEHWVETTWDAPFVVAWSELP
ncbi:MAG: beta-ketoacyl synthase N-terminal-like domain-containing protein [Myxococcales bacterium]